HVEESHLPNPLVCKLCDKRFTKEASVERHKGKHEDRKKYACFIGRCDKSFSRQDSLGAHLEGKHGERLRAAVKALGKCPGEGQDRD
ncbi:hypothetical protein C8A01DRAFT_14770, partial [Parachaetomium inaequale]